MGELLGKGLAHDIVLPLPVCFGAAQRVLPQPRLRFVYAQRGSASEGRAYKRGRNSLFVERVSAFVQRGHQRHLQELLAEAHGQTHIVGRTEAGREGMRRLRDLSIGEIVAHIAQRLVAQFQLLL